MAPKSSLRMAVVVMAAVCVLVLLTLPATAQANCRCTYGIISYRPSAPCWYGGPGTGGSVQVPFGERYNVGCQRRAGSIDGNAWWNSILYNGRNCWMNDLYMNTGCNDRCYNLQIC